MNVNYWILAVLVLLLANGRSAAQSLSEEVEQKARDLLRETMKTQEATKPAVNTPSPPPTAPQGRELGATGKAGRPLNYIEVEQAYLAGKISARQYQRYLETGVQPTTRVTPPMPPQAIVPTPAKGPQGVVRTAMTESNATAKTEVKVEDPGASSITEVENKVNELLRLKAVREQAAANAAAAAASTNTAAGPKSNREQMDDLLKLYIDGNISEAEYQAKREKLLGE
jgi:hypothetical protein